MAEVIKIVRCEHPLADSGDYFTVDTQTRTISHPNPKSLVLVQGDTNSEVYTICIPKYIDSHPVDACNMVEIHFINTGSNNEVREDIQLITELKEYPDDSENLYAEWILSGNTSMYNGNLSFAMRFMCAADDEAGTILYSWSTLPFTGISVGRTIINTESVYVPYSDIIAQWYDKLTKASGTLDSRIEDDIRAAERAIENKGKVVAGSLSERYKEYGAEGYVYYLNLTFCGCGSGAGSVATISGIPISILYAEQKKYIRLCTSTNSIETLEVYIGDNDYPNPNNSFISGYASLEWWGDENTPDDIDIKFSVTLSELVDNPAGSLTIECGHVCAYEPESFINGYSYETLFYKDVSSFESYVEDVKINHNPGSLLNDYQQYFSIEKFKSVKPMIDQSVDNVRRYVMQYADTRFNDLLYNPKYYVNMYDRNTNEIYSVFIENGKLKVEPYIEE